MTAMDRERRFGGVARLYGQDGAEALRSAHVCVVGIGGVGSWAAEALARTGVGRITLIDLDMVAESNTNRQIHALGDLYGKAKVEAMAERIHAINPECEIHCIDDFVTPDNAATMLDRNFTAVIDAIDQVRAKVAMIAFCRRHKLPIVVAGAAGGQIDPTQVRAADLSQTVQDPLLAKVRSSLRRDHGFPRDAKKKFGVSAIFSTEALRYPGSGASCDIERGPAGLNCAGFGSSVCVTSVFGMAAAAQVVNLIVKA
ncbi:tRNA cyclic N6-threonylcarbamoyladenosine(37) synthase TcdA [Dechloromonas sp. XY25]|uniref:tRNA cyclic N6-threonylcarbamoyladenosine(37) synthase TcdA n=2 Tax=Dechloromonas hankyongensis TaxID=2908002 RepID=A0ABS9K7M7_9RHOO|nr:tRNA cyclic N6-threonylcarbamoyladenosine(37) synthase TcdA [Dechloromonas hankyongensis]MCG2579172.1 tRNA cyclic N6-threonylcarbamoyladenosine(37) synthase TcdA [Dechloromonas hankyongensis]